MIERFHKSNGAGIEEQREVKGAGRLQCLRMYGFEHHDG